MKVQTYLSFGGRCEQALEFYRQALGAEVECVMRFKDSPDQSMNPPGSAEKVMHSSFRIGDTSIMATDGECQGPEKFQGFSLTLNAENKQQAERYFNALSDGGQVRLPLTETFFAQEFGMVADRFGVSWMVIVPKQTS